MNYSLDRTPQNHGKLGRVPRPYRVLLVDLAWYFGGVETRILDQARGLQGRVAQCRVATREGSALHTFLQDEGLPCEPLPATRHSDPRSMFALRKVIRDGNYQIVDAHNAPSILWGHTAALLAGAPGRVATIHSDYRHETPGIKGVLSESILRLNRAVARQYITIADVLQAKMAGLGDANRSTLIYNTVPVPPRPCQAKAYDVQAAWGYAPSDFVVGIVARLDPRKGHTYLIEAIGQLRDVPHIKLLVVGDGRMRAQLEEQTAAAGLAERVRFAGFRTDPQDIPTVLRFIDCFCLPSLLEGLPYAVLEAAAYARPIVATSVGGMVALLEHGKTALLAPPRDPAALAERIRWLAAHPEDARRMGLAAYELIRRTYGTPTAMITKILAVYDQALM